MPVADIHGHRMYYEAHGDGEAVLAMTGWGSMTRGGTQRLPGGLLGRYKVILFDHRGIGESDDPPGVKHTSRLYADDAAALLDHLGVPRAHLVGLGGMGGCIAQEIAINYPAATKTLILSGAWAKADPYLWSQLETFRVLHDKVDFYAYQRCAALITNLPEYFNEHQDQLLGPHGAWRYINGKKEVHLKFITVCQEHDTVDRLHHVSAPTLLLQGSVEDQITGPRLAVPFRERIPNVEFVTIEGAPHSLHTVPAARQRHDEVIMRFIERHT